MVEESKHAATDSEAKPSYASSSPPKSKAQAEAEALALYRVKSLKYNLTHQERAAFDTFQMLLKVTKNVEEAKDLYRLHYSAPSLQRNRRGTVDGAADAGADDATVKISDLLEKIKNTEAGAYRSEKEYLSAKARQLGVYGRARYRIRSWFASSKKKASSDYIPPPPSSASSDVAGGKKSPLSSSNSSHSTIFGVNRGKVIAGVGVALSAIGVVLSFVPGLNALAKGARTLIVAGGAAMGFVGGRKWFDHDHMKNTHDLEQSLIAAYQLRTRLYEIHPEAARVEDNKDLPPPIRKVEAQIKAILATINRKNHSLHKDGRKLTKTDYAFAIAKPLLGILAAAGTVATFGAGAGVGLGAMGAVLSSQAAAHSIGGAALAINAGDYGRKGLEHKKEVGQNAAFKEERAYSLETLNQALGPHCVPLPHKTERWASRYKGNSPEYQAAKGASAQSNARSQNSYALVSQIVQNIKGQLQQAAFGLSLHSGVDPSKKDAPLLATSSSSDISHSSSLRDSDHSKASSSTSKKLGLKEIWNTIWQSSAKELGERASSPASSEVEMGGIDDDAESVVSTSSNRSAEKDRPKGIASPLKPYHRAYESEISAKNTRSVLWIHPDVKEAWEKCAPNKADREGFKQAHPGAWVEYHVEIVDKREIVKSIDHGNKVSETIIPPIEVEVEKKKVRAAKVITDAAFQVIGIGLAGAKAGVATGLFGYGGASKIVVNSVTHDVVKNKSGVESRKVGGDSVSSVLKNATASAVHSASERAR